MFSERIFNLIDKIIHSYENGGKIAIIAKENSINKKTVRKILIKNNIAIRKGTKNLLGKRFGRLQVISLSRERLNDKYVWSCRCDCGNFVKVRGGDLTSEKQISCGCIKANNKENIKRALLFRPDNRKGFKELTGKYLSSVKHNALIRKLEYSLTPQFLWELYISQDRKCKLSGELIDLTVPQTASLDRKDSNQGYTELNVQWVHKDINNMKMALSENRFVDLARKVAKHSNPGVLYGTRAYLAGNLEYSSDSYNWREKLTEEFSKLGITALDPTKVMFEGQPHETEEKRQELLEMRRAGRYDEVRDYMVPVVQKDLRQIDLSDFVVFNFQVDKPTFGTTHELVIATQQKKPIFVCVGDKAKTPLWFLGIVNPNYFYNSIEEIIEVINNINNGKKEIDSDKWRILKPEFR